MGYSTRADDIARDLAILRSDFNRSKSLQSGSYTEGLSPYFDYFRAKDGFFDRPIFEGFAVRRIGNMETLNSAITGIQFSTVHWNSGLLDKSFSTIVNSSQLPLTAGNSAGGRVFLAFGQVEWAGNSSGLRRVEINTVDVNNSTGTVTVDIREPAAFVDQTAAASFCVPLFESNLARFQYMYFAVEQETGSTLSVTLFNASVIRLF